MSCIASSWSSFFKAKEMVFLEDQSQPLSSPLSVDGVTDTQIFHAAGDDGEALRQALRQALRRRRGLSVTDVEHFTQEYKLGLTPTAVPSLPSLCVFQVKRVGRGTMCLPWLRLVYFCGRVNVSVRAITAKTQLNTVQQRNNAHPTPSTFL